MRLSYSKQVVDGFAYDGFWNTKVDWNTMEKIICNKDIVWSHCLFAGQYRKQFAFIGSYFCCLDIDDGLKKEEAIAALEGYKFILAPTKSDGKLKEGKILDRYRIIVPFNEPCTNLDVLRYNQKMLGAKLKADTNAMDAARFWSPSKKIEVLMTEGKDLTLIDSIPKEETTEHKKKAQNKRAKYFQRNKALPPTVLDILEGRVKPGDKNTPLFKGVCDMVDNHFTEDETLDYILAVPEYRNHSHTLTTIRSAYRYKAGGIANEQ